MAEENSAINVTQSVPATEAPVTTAAESTNQTDKEGAAIPSGDLATAFRHSAEGTTPEKPAEEGAQPVLAEKPKPADKPLEIPADRWEQYATEQFNGLKPADLKTRLTEYEALKSQIEQFKANPLSLLDEKEQEVLGVYRSGIDPSEYRQLQATDYTKMEPREVLFAQYKKDNPTVPAHLVDYLFDEEMAKKYPNLEAEEESKPHQADQFKLETDAEKTRQQLIEYQKKNRYTPPTPTDPPPTTERKAEVPQIDQEAAKRHLTNVTETIQQHAKLTFDWKDAAEQARSVAVEVGNAEPIKAFMENPGQYLDAYLRREMLNEKGEVNYAKLHRLGTLLHHVDQVVKVAYETGGDQREIQLRKERTNAAPSTAAPTDTELPLRSLLAEGFRKEAQATNGK